MPEFHQIQLFLSLETHDFRIPLTALAHIFADLGWADEHTQLWLASLDWNEADNGFVYFDHAPTRILHCDDALLSVSPMILGWTTDAYPALQHPWVEFSFLFHTEELQVSPLLPNYKPGRLRCICSLMNRCHMIFPETAIYLTDEAQDGQPFEGLIEDNQPALWSFDLALIPDTLGALYTVPPRQYEINHKQSHLQIHNAKRIDFDPWEA